MILELIAVAVLFLFFGPGIMKAAYGLYNKNPMIGLLLTGVVGYFILMKTKFLK